MLRAVGGYYADQEFDLGRLAHLRDDLVEVGRSCVHPAYRSGAAILLLWGGLLRYMRIRGHGYLFGCASIPMADGGLMATSLWHALRKSHLSPAEERVFPRCRLPVEQLVRRQEGAPAVAMPPLIKGYINIGARVCGEPAWDPEFNTADLPVLLSVRQMNERYSRHFGMNA